MAWYNASWTKRLPVTLDNSANAFGLSYLAVGISITGSAYTSLNASANADRSDIRVTDSDGTTLLSHWLEDTTIASSVMLLVKVPQIAASTTKTIYVYYGNAGATTTSTASGTVKSANIPPLSGTPTVTVDATAAVFNGPAAIETATNGNIVCVYTSGGDTNYGHNGGGLFVTISTDNGGTWSARATITAGTAGNSKLPRVTKITKLANGDLICGIEKDTDANVVGATGLHYILKSTDNGVNWTTSTSISTPAGFTTAQGYSQILEISSGGDLLWIWQGVRSGGDTKTSAFIMKCASGADYMTGSNWGLFGGSVAASTVMRDASQTLAYNECDFEQLTSTNFIAVSRVGTGSTLVKSTSTDTAVTWAAPSAVAAVTGETGTVIVSPGVHRLSNGDLLLTWAERTGQVNSAIGMGSSISTDNGTTWTQFAMPYFGTSASADYGYSSTEYMSNGKLLTVVPLGNAAGGTSTASTLYSFTWDEDWACNPYADYRDIANTTSFTLGANAARTTSIGHSGTDSLDLNNNTSGGGTGATVLYLIGNQSSGYAKKAVAVNFWINVDQDAAINIANAIKEGTTVSTTGSRIHNQILSGTSPFADKYYDGANSQDWTTPATIVTDTWYKKKLKGKTASTTSIAGGLAINNVLAGNNATNAFNGTNNLLDRMYWQAGSVSTTNAVRLYVDDVYTTQYVAVDPTFSVGAEELMYVHRPVVIRQAIKLASVY